MTGKQQPLAVDYENAIAWVTLDHPPLNLLDQELIPALARLSDELRSRDDVQVVVLQSADPEFFCAHGDMRFVTEPSRFTDINLGADPVPLNPMQALHEQLRDLPQVTIAKLAGFARGGGLELAMALDMRFAAKGKTFLAHPEAPMAIMPGGGGTQYLSRLIGPARALEAIVTGGLIDAEQAEAWGLVNRALEPWELDAFVSTLARRIAALAPRVARSAKASVRAAATDKPAGLAVENGLIGPLFMSPHAREVTEAALAAGAQTREGERDLEAIADQLLNRPTASPR